MLCLDADSPSVRSPQSKSSKQNNSRRQHQIANKRPSPFDHLTFQCFLVAIVIVLYLKAMFVEFIFDEIIFSNWKLCKNSPKHLNWPRFGCQWCQRRVMIGCGCGVRLGWWGCYRPNEFSVNDLLDIVANSDNRNLSPTTSPRRTHTPKTMSFLSQKSISFIPIRFNVNRSRAHLNGKQSWSMLWICRIWWKKTVGKWWLIAFSAINSLWWACLPCHWGVAGAAKRVLFNA